MKNLRITMLMVLAPLISFSWNSSGHMTGGAIAYYYLKQHDPAVLEKVISTLQNHPWYTSEWANKMAGLTSEQKKVALFMLASTWPDEVRDIPELGGGEKKKWHYINYPFVPEGQTVTGAPIPTPNAQEKIQSLLTSLKTQTESQEKAIDICWLFHLIEDVHQPLHTVALFDSGHLHGDKGGNDTYIKLDPTASATILHSYWDKLVKGTFQNIPSTAQSLLESEKYKEGNLSEITANQNVTDWIVKESVELAKKDVYLNGKINGEKENPTSVDNVYINSATTIAEKRVVLSGIRLAKKLMEIYN